MSTVDTKQPTSVRVDRLGAVASSLCAVHCVLCALLPAAFGVLGLSILASHEAEWGLTLLAVGFAMGALILGWRRHHSKVVATLFLVGVMGLLASRGLEMGTDHHDHHDHHATAQHAEPHHEEGHHEQHHEQHHEEVTGGVTSHLAGSALGIFSGLLLLTGHMVNLRETRRCQRGCA